MSLSSRVELKYRLIAALKKTTNYQTLANTIKPKRATLVRAINWLYKYVQDAQWYPCSELPSDDIQKALSCSRPKEKVKLYRGTENPFKEKVFTSNEITSWSYSKSVAKKFADKDGSILKTTANPSDILVDVNLISSEAFLQSLGFSVNDLKFFKVERFALPEAEVILLPGTYQIEKLEHT